jgi:3-oxoacyl-[acyl-carrier protein] reductase
MPEFTFLISTATVDIRKNILFCRAKPLIMDFTGKNVLITGGSRGIGRAAALAFAGRGARVAINFHQQNEAARETIGELPGEGHFAVKADVGSPVAVRRMFDAAIGEFGRIDIVVNNAAVWRHHAIDELGYEDWQMAWRALLDINLIGPANVCYCAAQHMIGQGGGRIVNVSSRGAFRGEPGAPAYGASKAGLNALSQSLAQALAPHNIFVGVVAPGYTDTEMAGEVTDEIRNQSPLKRIARPEEVAYAILFLASEGAEFTTGTILDVNGASYLRS